MKLAELSFIKVAVIDEDFGKDDLSRSCFFFSSFENVNLVGLTYIPAAHMKKGYRSIQLYNDNGELLENSIVHVRIE